jgi:hypothetical protein
MTEKSVVTPSAMIVQTKRKAPLGVLAIWAPTPAPIMWMMGMPNPRRDPRSMMTYPDRLSESTSVPYSHTARMGRAVRFEVPPFPSRE